MFTMEDLTEKALEILTSRDFWRTALASIAILACLGPWLRLDGDDALSGVQLFTLTLTGPGRGDLLGQSFIAGAAVLLLPPLVVILTITTAVRCTLKAGIVKTTLAALAAAALLLMLSPAVTSNNHQMFLGWTAPQWGLILTLLCLTLTVVERFIPPLLNLEPGGRSEDRLHSDPSGQQVEPFNPDDYVSFGQPRRKRLWGRSQEPNDRRHMPAARDNGSETTPERRRKRHTPEGEISGRMPPERRRRFTERMIERNRRERRR